MRTYYGFDKSKLNKMVAEAKSPTPILIEEAVEIVNEYSDKQRSQLKKMVDDLENKITKRNPQLKGVVGKLGSRGRVTKVFSKGVDREIKKHGLTNALEYDKKLSDLANKTYATYLKAMK